MTTRTAILLGAGWIAANLVLAAAYAGAHRYTMIETSDNGAWKVDQLTGQTYECEEGENGPFCQAAPNHIKHSREGY